VNPFQSRALVDKQQHGKRDLRRRRLDRSCFVCVRSCKPSRIDSFLPSSNSRLIFDRRRQSCPQSTPPAIITTISAMDRRPKQHQQQHRRRSDSNNHSHGGSSHNKNRDRTASNVSTPSSSNSNGSNNSHKSNIGGLQRDYSVLDLNADMETVVSNKTIGLFGAETKTGQHFMRAALDAGYHVRALQLPNLPNCSDYPNLEWIYGESLYDTEALAMVVHNAQYVVCMANGQDSVGSALNHHHDDHHHHHHRSGKGGRTSKPEQAPMIPIDATKPMACFIQLLYPILKKQSSVKVFLFQANSLASDTKGRTPVFSKVLKSARTAGALAHNVLRNRSNHQNTAANGAPDALADLDSCIHEIAAQHKRSDNNNCPAKFAYIVTRPTTFLQDGTSQGGNVAVASKSQPTGVFPLRHVDLAVFSLNSLLKRRLYQSCPYVVADHHQPQQQSHHHHR
jgi:hypothetical protein